MGSASLCRGGVSPCPSCSAERSGVPGTEPGCGKGGSARSPLAGVVENAGPLAGSLRKMTAIWPESRGFSTVGAAVNAAWSTPDSSTVRPQGTIGAEGLSTVSTGVDPAFSTVSTIWATFFGGAGEKGRVCVERAKGQGATAGRCSPAFCLTPANTTQYNRKAHLPDVDGS